MTIDATNQFRSSVISLSTELDRVIEFDLSSSLPIHIYTFNCIIYTPSVNLESEVKANVWAHPELTAPLSQKDALKGNLFNAENIGKTVGDLIIGDRTEEMRCVRLRRMV